MRVCWTNKLIIEGIERAGELMSDGTFIDLEIYRKLKCG